MNTQLKKLISNITAAAMTISMFTGVITAKAEGTKAYEFDMENVTEFGADIAKSMGFTFDTSSIWTPSLVTDKNSVYTPAARFTTRNSDSSDYNLYTMTFSDDTVNNPDANAFTADGYSYEMEFAAVYNSDSYMTLDFIGKDSGGNEVQFANGRITFNRSADTGTFTFVDADGNQVGTASAAFPMNNKAINNNKIGVPSTLQYIKVDFDFLNGKFSAWHTSRKTNEGEYTPTAASDDNKIVDAQPLNITGIEEFVGISAKSTANSATNGYWIHHVSLEEIEVKKEEESEATPTPTPTPTPIPEKGLIDEENFEGKTVSGNALNGWNFYDKLESVASLPNITLALSNKQLKIQKTGTADETDYSTRYRSMYRFKQTIEEDENTKTYKTDFYGKYRIETVVVPHVQSGSQFQQVIPAIAASGTTPDLLYNMCIDSSGVYEYISSSDKPKIYSGMVVDADTKIIYEVDTDEGTLITRVNDGEDYAKTFTPGTPLQGIMYVLKSKAKTGDYMTVKSIKLYGDESDTTPTAAQEAAKSLLITDLTATPDGVGQNLNSLPNAVCGASVSWSSSNPTVMDDTGKLLEQPLEGTVDVTMTATISVGDDVVYKDFNLKIRSMDSSDFELIDDVDFSKEANVIVTPGGANVTTSADKIILTRTNTSQTPSVKIYPIWGDMQFAATGAWLFEADIAMPSGYQKAEVGLFDATGSRITSFYTTHKSSGTVLTGVSRETLDGDAVHTEIKKGSTGAMSMKLKVMFNTDTQRLSLYAALDGNDYTTIVENKYIREDATELEYITISAPTDNNQGNTSLYGTIEINDIKLYTPTSNKLKLAIDNMDYFGSVESLGGYVRNDIELETKTYPGTSVTWTSSNPEILTNEGVLNTEAYDSDTLVSLTCKVTLDETGEFEEKTFDLTALWIDINNIAMGKTADTGKTQPMTGHNATKAVDGSTTSYWQTMRFSDLPSLKIDLGSEQVLTKTILYEAEMMGAYPITGYSIEISKDGSSWKTVHTGDFLGSESVSVDMENVIARYVRFNVKSKLDDYCVGLREIMIYSAVTDEEKAEADIILALNEIGALTNLRSSKTLPKTTQYGSVIEYKSSIPSNFSNTGKVTQDTKAVSGTLTITATIGDTVVTKEVPVSVAKKSTSVGGGGGGGSSSGGSSGGGVVIPALPTADENISQSTQDYELRFKDVPKSFWAYDQIENLAIKGVILGDEQKNFRPNDSVSRQEFVKILLLAFGIDTDTETELNFDDVTKDDWSYSYIAKAVELGIVKGKSETEFDKTSPISREDIAVMCQRMLSALDKYNAPEGTVEFADSDLISGYAYEAVNAMNESGIISGYDDNSFRPKNNATRAESAKIMYMLTK